MYLEKQSFLEVDILQHSTILFMILTLIESFLALWTFAVVYITFYN